MESLNLPESITVRFKASVHSTPEAREMTREALARACEGHPVTEVPGFESIKPYRARTETAAPKASDRKGYSRTRKTPRLLKDEVLAQVGGSEALARFLGVSAYSVRNWSCHIPERHELMTRELLRNWKKFSPAVKLLDRGLAPALVSRTAGLPLDELLDLCDRFRVTFKNKH